MPNYKYYVSRPLTDPSFLDRLAQLLQAISTDGERLISVSELTDRLLFIVDEGSDTTDPGGVPSNSVQ
jgi:hypothetical protein